MPKSTQSSPEEPSHAIPSGEEGVTYAEQFTKPRSFEGKPEEAPGIGKFSQESLRTELLMLPRSEKEIQQYKDFFAFVHGAEFRSTVADQLTMMKVDPQQFDAMGWEFYDRYVHGEKMATIVVQSLERKRLAASMLAQMGGDPLINQLMQNEFTETFSTYSDHDKSVRLDMSEARLKPVTPALMTMHELGHATQQQNEVVVRGPGESLPKEIIALMDAVAMLLIDQQLRRDRKLSPIAQGEAALYATPIRFPSGIECTPAQLASLGKAFYNLSQPDSKRNFDQSAIQLFASDKGTAFIDRLIYGDAGRSHDIVVQTNGKSPAAVREMIERDATVKELWDREGFVDKK